MSLLAISWESTVDIQNRGFFLSLFEAIFFSVAVRGPIFVNMGRSPLRELCGCVRERVCVFEWACACECFNMFSVIGWMSSAWCCHTKNNCVMTSSLLSLLGYHDVNDGNAGRTLRLCCFMFLFFFSTWPRCCLPSVYVNSCHTKKSHINSKRHNKLLLWDYGLFISFSLSSKNVLSIGSVPSSSTVCICNHALPGCINRGSS